MLSPRPGLGPDPSGPPAPTPAPSARGGRGGCPDPRPPPAACLYRTKFKWKLRHETHGQAHTRTASVPQPGRHCTQSTRNADGAAVLAGAAAPLTAARQLPGGEAIGGGARAEAGPTPQGLRSRTPAALPFQELQGPGAAAVASSPGLNTHLVNLGAMATGQTQHAQPRPPCQALGPPRGPRTHWLSCVAWGDKQGPSVSLLRPQEEVTKLVPTCKKDPGAGCGLLLCEGDCKIVFSLKSAW